MGFCRSLPGEHSWLWLEVTLFSKKTSPQNRKTFITQPKHMIGSPRAKWVTFRLLLFSPQVRFHNWKLPGSSSHILLIFITWKLFAFFFMKETRRKDIYTLESKFFISSQSTFLNYNSFHKLLSNKKNLVVLWLLLYKLCKNNNETWFELSFEKFFNLKLVEYFRGTMGYPELEISGSCIGIVCEVKICFYLQFFSCLFFQFSGE